jgi:soluble lytic murein transglycosylase-like protein
MKNVVPSHLDSWWPNTLTVKDFVLSGADFFRQKPYFVWSLCAFLICASYVMDTNKNSRLGYSDVSFENEKHFVLVKNEQTLGEQLSDLESFYLEDLLFADKETSQVITSPNMHLDQSFYHLDKVSKTFYRKSSKYLKKYKKEVLEQKMIAALPKNFRENAKLYIKPILKMSEKYQLDPIWLISIMWTESHFKYRAKSGVGASGLMQIMPATQKYLVERTRKNGISLEAMKGWDHLASMNPNIKTWREYKRFKYIVLNIELGAFYLKRLLKTFNSHLYATVAYNMGPGWTSSRLRRNRPIGNKNIYVDKVRKAYKFILRNFPKA